MRFIAFCDRIIEYSFYGLFLLVPLAFTSKTSELFEMNKMWLTWGLTIIIAMAWFTKMILQRRILFKRTPLDIPIGLFLLSQIISTIFSLDFHTSLWGYYSRFNGGLLSIISYIFLYYALITFANEGVAKEEGRPDSAQRSEHWREGLLLTGPRLVKRMLSLSLVSGLIVALWGLPSHFGYDPTCLLFRGTLDVSCWTADFLPKIRIFSTLGQPDWLAAYLAILIPITIAFYLKKRASLILNHLSLILIALFYIDLLYTRARSGFIGIWIALIVFAALYYWTNKPKISLSSEKLKSPIAVLFFSFLILTFIIGAPINQLSKFSLEGIGNLFQKTQTSKSPAPAPAPAQSSESGGTDLGNIRLIVWEGALNAWKNNPIFGTGVETFAFAYYKYKPAAHNLTSEWNFLYNKAHNEYLNFLATTGLLGLGTYLLMIGSFLFLVIKKISKSEFLISNQVPNPKSELGQLEIRSIRNLTIALLAAYVSILVTNFFGFSVVITNIYLFMIPAFIFVLSNITNNTFEDKNLKTNDQRPLSIWQWAPIILIVPAGFFMLFSLLRFWQADIAFALGYNLDRAQEYQQAYPNLHRAVALRGDEPVFKDELSLNNAVIATGLVSQKPEDEATSKQTVSVASALAQEAINTSNTVVSQNQNNAVFWKTRTRLFFTLSQVDSRYLPRALDAIEKAGLLAPNDANIWYNLGVLYGQNGNLDKGISTMEKVVTIKPDYRDAHYALGLFYNQKDPSLRQKAIDQMQYILKNLNSKDTDALKSLEEWTK